MATRPTKRGKNSEVQPKDKLFDKLSSEKDNDIVYMYHFSDEKFDEFDLTKTQYRTHFNLTPDKQWLIEHLSGDSHTVGGENDNGYLHTVAVRGFDDVRTINKEEILENDMDNEEYAATLKEPLVWQNVTGHLMVFDPSRVEIVKTETMRDFSIPSNEFNIDNQNRDDKYKLYYEIRDDNPTGPGVLLPKPVELVTTEDLSSDEILKVAFEFIQKDKKQGSMANAYSFILRDSSNSNMATKISIDNINEDGKGGSIRLDRFSKRFTDSPDDSVHHKAGERAERLLSKISKPYEFSQDEIEQDIRFRELAKTFDQTGQEYIERIDNDMKEKYKDARKKWDKALKEWNAQDPDTREPWQLPSEIKNSLEESRPNFERGIIDPLPVITLNDINQNDNDSVEEISESLSAKDGFEELVRMEHAQMGKAFKGRKNRL